MNKKIINQLLLKGKRTTSEKIWLKSVKFFYKLFNKNHKEFINRALINVTPLLKVKQLKQKNKRSQLKEFPYIVNNANRVSSTLKFFLTKTNNKDEKKMHKKLINELLLATKNTGTNISKKKVCMNMLLLKKVFLLQMILK
uniref:Ribosomal protein S7 n=1 Tax=Skeletonema marinoi TaxID=267567 RepID=A0A0S2M9T5_9STRA|nr:ribosomal protein S7 [Skeletonema marinoi]ALO71443.1 ribosomal protein S7 [Skeletonema marinoi]